MAENYARSEREGRDGSDLSDEDEGEEKVQSERQDEDEDESDEHIERVFKENYDPDSFDQLSTIEPVQDSETATDQEQITQLRKHMYDLVCQDIQAYRSNIPDKKKLLE